MQSSLQKGTRQYLDVRCSLQKATLHKMPYSRVAKTIFAPTKLSSHTLPTVM